MSKTIIYSCIFFNEKYINLINLLLKSYKLFCNSHDDVEYLIICNNDYEEKIKEIFDNLNINGKIWCMDLKTKFESCWSRYEIFNYPDIDLYNKILYLDCDILVTNSINNILDFQLENKLYVLAEGITSHNFWGAHHFKKGNPRCTAFSSGILLFNNNIIIKELFEEMIKYKNVQLNNYTGDSPNAGLNNCILNDQPLLVYFAFKNKLYDNEKLINIVINNPKSFANHTISHFPGGPGNYENKINKMRNYMNNFMFNLDKTTNADNALIGKKYLWMDSNIEFLENYKMNAFGHGNYSIINKYLVNCYFDGHTHLIKFNEDYSTFFSIRKSDFAVVFGNHL